ncbi:hypothetical protein SUGI_1138640 [Cryptomeria japonica]|uniref:aquaporin PIP2-5-like n=1 Tax=Cryptomeria japonica TaxID=3369 RepID=UPI0024149919|nr:aquaporin PIP2-5-like [Cryptomeria japonica]GLJ53390.1 hypothetical protein SUGI_1138640 [Cryptomeria japonica]
MAKKSGNEMEKGIYSPTKDYNHGSSHVHSNFSSNISNTSTSTVPAPLFNRNELRQRSLYRAIMAEFLSTLVFVLITIGTLIEHAHGQAPCGGTPNSSSSLGMFGLARSFGGMIFILVYCTFGFSGAHINPAVTLGLFLARKLSLARAVMYVVAQCAGAVCGAGLVKGLFRAYYIGSTADYNIAIAYGEFKYADFIIAFVLIYTLFSATEPQQNYFPVMGPLPVGLGVLIIYLAVSNAMAEDGDDKGRISPARIDAYVVRFWIQWLLWVGPLLGAAAAAAYHQYSLRLGSASKGKSMEDLKMPSMKRSP